MSARGIYGVEDGGARERRALPADRRVEEAAVRRMRRPDGARARALPLPVLRLHPSLLRLVDLLDRTASYSASIRPMGQGEPARARMWEAGGRWFAHVLDVPAYIEVTGTSRASCLAELRKRDGRRRRSDDRGHPGRRGGRGGRGDHGLGQAAGDHVHRSRLVPGADQHPRVRAGSGSGRTSRTTPTTGERPIHRARPEKPEPSKRCPRPRDRPHPVPDPPRPVGLRLGRRSVGERPRRPVGPAPVRQGTGAGGAPREAAPRDGPGSVRRVLVPAPARDARPQRHSRARRGPTSRSTTSSWKRTSADGRASRSRRSSSRIPRSCSTSGISGRSGTARRMPSAGIGSALACTTPSRALLREAPRREPAPVRPWRRDQRLRRRAPRARPGDVLPPREHEPEQRRRRRRHAERAVPERRPAPHRSTLLRVARPPILETPSAEHTSTISEVHTVSVKFLSDEWAQALKAELNQSDAFRQAAAGQKATIQQVITGSRRRHALLDHDRRRGDRPGDRRHRGRGRHDHPELRLRRGAREGRALAGDGVHDRAS